MVKLIQSSLSGGEVSPDVAVRVDIDRYRTSVAQALNFWVDVHGGLFNRAGLKFVGQVKDSADETRVVDFSFNTEQTYILEFGDMYMRVIKDGQQVLETGTDKTITGATQADPVVITATAHGYSNGDEVYISGVGGMTELNLRNFRVANVTANTFELQDLLGTDIDGTSYTAFTSGGTSQKIYELTTPYAEADVFDLKLVQSADTMTITHPDYDVRELARTDHDAWTISVIEFRPQQVQPTGMSVTVNSTGSETDRYVVTAVNRDSGEESLPARATGGTAITGITQADPGVVTATAHGLEDGDEVWISGVVGMTEVNDAVYKVANKTTNTFELTDINGDNVDTTSFTAWSSGGTVDPMYYQVNNSNSTRDNTISWTAAANAETYNIYRRDNGLYGFVGRTEALTFDDENIDPDTADTPPRSRDPFKSAATYPATAGYHKQRRLFGRSDTFTQRFWMTQTGNYYNLAVSSPAKDDDAITASIFSRKVNEIRHFVSLKDLIILTSGGEWLLSGVDGIIKPTGINIEPQSYFGATDLEPIVAGDVILYVQPGQIVRDLNYTFETDSYAGTDVSVLARHLFEAYTLTDWTFAQAPHSHIWCTRNDGGALCLSYLREQDVFGWTQHETRGDFKSCAAIREGDDDFTYFVVERVINGQTVKYIERMATRVLTDIQDSFFVDAGLTLDNPITITGYTQADPVVVTAPSHGLSNGDTVDITGLQVKDSDVTRGYRADTDIEGTGYTVANVTANTFELQNNAEDVDGTGFKAYHSGGEVRLGVTSVGGLWHLEGEEVVILANGYVIEGQSVSNGTVSLNGDTASRIHVGLKYTAEIETLRINAGDQQNTIQGRAKHQARITIRFRDTLGGWLGPTRTQMKELKYGLPELFGQPPLLLTGDKDATLKPSWNKEGSMIIQQRDPLPMGVLSIIPDFTPGGN